MELAKKRIQLSSEQMQFIKRSSFLPTSLARVLDAAQFEGNEALAIYISRDVAEAFRSAFTDQLAKVGFNDDYELTSEGRMLEELIDHFYLVDGT